MFENVVSFGRYGEWCVAVMATLCSLSSGQSYSFMGAALPKFLDGSAEIPITTDEAAWMNTMTFVGSFTSPIPSGYLMDKIGRRNTLTLTLLLSIASWLILAVFRYSWAVLLARFLGGMWGGVVYTVVPAFLGEVVDPKIRGAMATFIGAMMLVGAVYMNIAATLSYQMFIIVSTIPSVVLFVGFLFLPESPYFYLVKGKREKAKESITWLKGQCKDSDLDYLQEKVNEQLQMKGSFADIFRTKVNRKIFAMVEFLGIIQRCCGLTFVFAYTAVVVPDSWVTSDKAFLVVSAICTVASFLFSIIIDKYNRRTILAISCLGSGLFMGSLAVWFYIRDFSTIDVSSLNWFPLVFIIVGSIFYCLGVMTIPQLVQGELFPVNIKSKGGALACITANMSAALNVKFFYDINDNIGMYFNFVIITVSLFMCLIFVYTCMVETKGESLESIQDILNGKTPEKGKGGK